MKTPKLPVTEYAASERETTSRKTLRDAVIVFGLSFLLLFLGMYRRPGLYDEGLVLTAAMRVGAGQIPHRDFYANYGPAGFYILAGLFKVFGQSLLVERLYDLFVKALLVASTYTFICFYCRRSIAIWTSIATFLWLYGLGSVPVTVMIPVSLLNLIASALILPIFLHPISIKRTLAAGAIAGLGELFRYDIGFALLGIQACVIAIAVCRRTRGITGRLMAFWSAFWPYLVGFVIVVLPPALFYLSVAPIRDIAHDILIYPAQYYHRSRNLPFPRITLKGLDNIAVYLPIAIVGISTYVFMAGRSREHGDGALNTENQFAEQNWRGFLITFCLLAFVMYFKGWVRMSPGQMYLSTIPSLLLLAMLFQHRRSFPRFVGISIVWLMWLSMIAAALFGLRETRLLYKQHASMPEEMLLRTRRATLDTPATWCNIPSPLTIGFCFSSDDDHIRTIEFIRRNTKPDQKLYVGLPRHDRIYANDNLLYFATQRLPATKWSHFDPNLQNSYPIQVEMVHELDANAPPYVVLDSEFDADALREPNDASRSTGVTLLDDYIHSKYQQVESFGELSIWQRIPAP
jgi:hypothetical protein